MQSNLTFEIETCNPQNNSFYNEEDTKLSEAIYTIFPLDTEDAILVWGNTDMTLSYRYDISTIIDDLIQMVVILINESSGEWSVDWPSNTFATDWVFKWQGNELTIKTRWYGGLGDEDYLNENNILKIDKVKFLYEWKKIIDILIINLEKCGYTPKTLTDMFNLIEARDLIRDIIK